MSSYPSICAGNLTSLFVGLRLAALWLCLWCVEGLLVGVPVWETNVV